VTNPFEAHAGRVMNEPQRRRAEKAERQAAKNRPPTAQELETMKRHVARAMGAEAVTLPVSHAFHSELVAEATPILATVLERERFTPLQGRVISTVTGSLLVPDTDLRELICRQVTTPVRFLEAVVAASRDVDLWIETGGPEFPRPKIVGLSIELAGVALRFVWRINSGIETLLREFPNLRDQFPRPIDRFAFKIVAKTPIAEQQRPEKFFAGNAISK